MERLFRASWGRRTAGAVAILLVAGAAAAALAPGLARAAAEPGLASVRAPEAARSDGTRTTATTDRTKNAHNGPLARPTSWQALLRESAENGEPVIVLFSTPGCGFCELVRRDHLRHLAREQGPRGMRIVEFGLADRGPLEAREFTGTGTGKPSSLDGSPAANAPSAPLTPAALAASLGIRVAPTVAFFGPRGELAERLVGYQSADFYGAYLDERIATARAALAEDKTR